MPKIQILGVDPSLRNFGFAVAELDLDTLEYDIKDLYLSHSESESKKTVRRNSDDLRCCVQVHEKFQEMCKGKTVAIVEIPVGSQSARAMASYGMCIGILSSCPIPMIQVTPTEVKVASFGTKTATKEEMIEWAYKKFPNAPWKTKTVKGEKSLVAANEHLADAVAAIEAGTKTAEFRQAISMMKSMVIS